MELEGIKLDNTGLGIQIGFKKKKILSRDTRN